jgi:hypothetical protein
MSKWQSKKEFGTNPNSGPRRKFNLYSNSGSFSNNNKKEGDNTKKAWRSGSAKTGALPFGVSQKGRPGRGGGDGEEEEMGVTDSSFMRGAGFGDTKRQEQRRIELATEEERLDEQFGYSRLTDGHDRLGWLINIQPVCCCVFNSPTILLPLPLLPLSVHNDFTACFRR